MDSETPQPYRRAAFLQILLGAIIVTIDISLNGFDLLLDLVGYALIFFALRQLEVDDVSFRRAKACTLAGALVSLPLIAPSMRTALPGQLLGIVETAFQLLIVWYLCTGIVRLAQACGNVPLSNFAAMDRALFTASGIATIGLGILVLSTHAQFPAFVAVPLVVIDLFAALLIALLLWKAGAEIA
jgi:hypothetical protein